MARLRSEVLVALIIAALGGFFMYQATLIEFSQEDLVGPRLVPMLIAGLIIGLAGLMAVASFITGDGRSDRDESSVIGEGEPELAPVTQKAVVRMAAIIGVGFVYVFLFSATGYLISTTIALAALLVVFGNRPPIKVALVTAGGGIAYYLLFIKLMGIHDPGGWLIELGALGLG